MDILLSSVQPPAKRTSSTNINLQRPIPAEVYMMQNALDACTRQMQSLLNQYTQRQKFNTSTITMIHPIDVLVMGHHQDQQPFLREQQIKDALSPAELLILEQNGLMEDLVNHYIDAAQFINLDDIYSMLHQQKLYRNAYRQRYMQSESYSIGNGCMEADLLSTSSWTDAS